jgi:CheY-like chemotaxis protein
LGLAVVHGIVAQAQGYVTATSNPGKGTTFAMYLPATSRRSASKPEDESQEWVTGNETILLCEDESTVRRLIKETLTDAGYSVIEAENGKQALEIARVYGSPIHGLLTDLVMPEMNGQDLAEELARDHADLQVLFMSGYASGVVDGKRAVDNEERFLLKPFRPEELLQRLRATLDRQDSGG